MTFDQAMPLIALISGALAAYFGAYSAINVRLARLEEKHKALKERVDSDHARLDSLEKVIS